MYIEGTKPVQGVYSYGNLEQIIWWDKHGWQVGWDGEGGQRVKVPYSLKVLWILWILEQQKF